MSLYLSIIRLNPLFPSAAKLASDSEELHRRLVALLPCHKGEKPRVANQPKTAAVLFRVDFSDSGPDILIQSSEKPDWESLELAPRALRAQPETKPFEPTFTLGQRLSFRLLTRPASRKYVRKEDRENAARKTMPRLDLKTDEERIAWLHTVGARSGFVVESVGLTHFNMKSIKSEVPFRHKGGSFTAIRFDGVLQVSAADKLTQAVANGIGQQKAFGFGLLSLALLE